MLPSFQFVRNGSETDTEGQVFPRMAASPWVARVKLSALTLLLVVGIAGYAKLSSVTQPRAVGDIEASIFKAEAKKYVDAISGTLVFSDAFAFSETCNGLMWEVQTHLVEKPKDHPGLVIDLVKASQFEHSRCSADSIFIPFAKASFKHVMKSVGPDRVNIYKKYGKSCLMRLIKNSTRGVFWPKDSGTYPNFCPDKHFFDYPIFEQKNGLEHREPRVGDARSFLIWKDGVKEA